jgi:hypothetical protein
MNMNKNVDVLAELDELMCEFATAPSSLVEARAAVAELIDTAEEALHTLGDYAEALDRERGYGYSIERLAHDGEEPEYVSLRAALARVKGA